jgi:photosystem II stability/assembly factor-like uncharacterized protein
MKTLIMLFMMIVMISLIIHCKDDETDNPDDMLAGWIVGSSYDGYGTILYTPDGGKNWIRQGSADVIPNVPLEFVSAINDRLVWVCGDSIDGKPSILRTTDGGKNWQRIELPQTIPVVSYFGIGGVGEHIAWAAGQQNVIIKTTDGGVTWIRQDAGTNPDLVFTSMAVVDENNVWVVGYQWKMLDNKAYIMHTSDGGEHWDRQGENDIPAILDAFIDVHAISPTDAWAVGTGKGALRTTDGGQTWKDMDSPGGITHNNGVCMADTDNVWLAIDNSGALFYSEVTGSWQTFHLPTSSAAIWPVTMGTAAISKDIVWMVTSAGGDDVKGEVFYSDNGGATWTRQEIPVVAGLLRISFPKATR